MVHGWLGMIVPFFIDINANIMKCSGCISGLVAATPASGFIPPWASIILGVTVGTISNFSTKIKFGLRIDDSMDNFAEHGVAGMVGLIFNGFFAADYIIGLDGVSTGLINGGWLNHNWKQLYIQVAYVVACTAYSFVVSAVIAGLINLVPGLKLRASEEAELLGMDDDQLGEFAYDYVEVRRDYLAWTPASDEMEMEVIVPDKVQKDELRLRKMVRDNDAERTPVNSSEQPRHGEHTYGIAESQDDLVIQAKSR